MMEDKPAWLESFEKGWDALEKKFCHSQRNSGIAAKNFATKESNLSNSIFMSEGLAFPHRVKLRGE